MCPIGVNGAIAALVDGFAIFFFPSHYNSSESKSESALFRTEQVPKGSTHLAVRTGGSLVQYAVALSGQPPELQV